MFMIHQSFFILKDSQRMELKEKEFPEYSCVSMKANTTTAFGWSAEGWSHNHDHHGHQLLSADPHQGSAKSHGR